MRDLSCLHRSDAKAPKNVEPALFECEFFQGGVQPYWWTRGDSNPRPPRCERGALPAELLAHEQQIHLNKAEMGCQHEPNASFSAKKPEPVNYFPRMDTRCVFSVAPRFTSKGEGIERGTCKP